MNQLVKKLVAAYGSELIENRRYLHAHPELSFHKPIRPNGFAAVCKKPVFLCFRGFTAIVP